jgi:hypothetical protein
MSTSSIVDYKISVNEIDPNDSLLKIALALRPSWQNEAGNIKIKMLSGGITNTLMACYLAENDLDSSQTLLFRIYGKKIKFFV